MKSWRLLVGLLIVGVLTWANTGGSSPLEGRKARMIDVDKGNPGRWQEERIFVGGERACIIVMGDHQPVVDVGIEVREQATGNVVARDDGKGDLAAVVWYPPKDGVYTITVTNPSDVHNNCLIIVR